MIINFYYDCAYPFSKGGAEKRIYIYSKSLINELDVTIMSMKWWKGNKHTIFEGINYTSFSPLLRIYNKNGKRNVISSILFGWETFLQVLKRPPDLIDLEVFPYFPIIFAKLASFFKKKKSVIIAYWSECFGKTAWQRYSPPLWFAALCLEKLALWSADVHIANSEFTKRRLAKLGKLATEKIIVLPPAGIDLKLISDQNNNLKKPYNLIYYGRLIKHKNVDKIIQVLFNLKNRNYNLKLLIIGNGPDKEYLVAQANKLKLHENITFLDFIDDYRSLLSTIKQAKVLVAPSEREGFGISIIEANACGLPAIVMDFPDNASKELIIDGHNGFICKNDDEMLEKIEYLCNDANYTRLSERSRELARNYDIKVIEKKIKDTYLNISI